MSRPPAPPRRAGRGQWPLLLLLIGGVAAFAIVWSAGPFARQGGGSGPPQYTEAVVGAPRNVNPLLASLNEVDRDLSSLVFSGLTYLGPTGEVLPDLAQSWEVSPDGLTYIFHLRPQVRWHDGQPFTAQDVVFTYSLLADPAFPGEPALSQFWRQVQCEALDSLTVQCKLPEPFAPFLAYASIGILPSHLLKDVKAADLPNLSFNRAPVGTGPFRLLQMDEGRALLGRNPDYHLGPPHLERLELRFYPDVHAALTSLHRNEVQGLLLGPIVAQEDLDALASQERYRFITANRTTYTVIFFNTESPPLNDQKVRQALSLLIDRNAITAGLLAGQALPADTPMPPGTWAHNTAVEPRRADRKAAQQLLSEAGWQRGQDGLWRKDRQELRLVLVTDDDPVRQAIAREAARQLREAGIVLLVTPVGAQEMIQDYLIPRNFQMALFSVDPGLDPDPYPAWHSTQVSPEGRNVTGYADLDSDRLLEEARKTTDLTRRQALYYRFEDLFREKAPAVVLYYPLYTYVVNERLKGVDPGVLFYPASRFVNVWKWEIEGGGLPAVRPEPSPQSDH